MTYNDFISRHLPSMARRGDVPKSVAGIMLALCLASMYSCSPKSTTVSFLCDRDDIQIYVNGTYIGKGLATYTSPRGEETAVVECRKDGITIYSRNCCIKGHNGELLDLNVPDYDSYSSDRQIHSK